MLISSDKYIAEGIELLGNKKISEGLVCHSTDNFEWAIGGYRGFYP